MSDTVYWLTMSCVLLVSAAAAFVVYVALPGLEGRNGVHSAYAAASETGASGGEQAGDGSPGISGRAEGHRAETPFLYPGNRKETSPFDASNRAGTPFLYPGNQPWTSLFDAARRAVTPFLYPGRRAEMSLFYVSRRAGTPFLYPGNQTWMSFFKAGYQAETPFLYLRRRAGTAFFDVSRRVEVSLFNASLCPQPLPPAGEHKSGIHHSVAPAPEASPVPVLTAKLSFTGDLMVHQWQADAAYDAKTGEYDFNREFQYVMDDLSASDFTVGNLETTFSGGEYSDFPVFSAPDSFAGALKNAGFDFVTTANNHCNDKRTTGILRTLDTLDAAGLGHTGTFRSPEEQNEPRVAEINGVRFAFLSCTYGTNGIPVQAGADFLVNTLDKRLIKEQIEGVKALDPDIIVVLPHMGVEYSKAPSAETSDWVRYMLECGADVVVASHPHVIQTVEAGPDGVAAYSMGNFISCQRDFPRDYGMILNLEFEKRGDEKAVCVKVSFIPTWVKFVNSLGAYDIQTLPVRDAIEDYNAGNSMLIRPKDYRRLLDVNKEITARLLGKPAEGEREYTVWER